MRPAAVPLARIPRRPRPHRKNYAVLQPWKLEKKAERIDEKRTSFEENNSFLDQEEHFAFLLPFFCIFFGFFESYWFALKFLGSLWLTMNETGKSEKQKKS